MAVPSYWLTESRTATFMKTNAKDGSAGADFPDLESFYGDTKSEWYAAKHGKPSPAELRLANDISVSRCPPLRGSEVQNVRALRKRDEEIPMLGLQKGFFAADRNCFRRP